MVVKHVSSSGRRRPRSRIGMLFNLSRLCIAFFLGGLTFVVLLTTEDSPIINKRDALKSSEILPESIITEIVQPNSPVFLFGNGSKPSIECRNKFNKLGTWPDSSYNWIRAPQGTSKGVLFGSFYAQESIWRQQHPADCSNVKFLLLSDPIGSSFGSSLHIMSAELATAHTFGRIGIWRSNQKMWVNGEFCGAETSYRCYFERLTSCPLPTLE